MSKSRRLKSIPWPLMLEAGAVLTARWRSLSSKERARTLQLLRGSRGRVGNLSRRERMELRGLARKFDLNRTVLELVSLGRLAKRKRRR